MFAAPAEGTLKDFMEFAETGFADHEQSPPNQRTHATEHYAELINRNRRYGRFRNASSLPKPTSTPSNRAPRNLPLSSLTVIASVRIIGRVSQRAQFSLHHRLRHHERMAPLRVDVLADRGGGGRLILFVRWI